MAGDDINREVLEWKKKYEASEKNLQQLKELAHKAIGDYDELQRKYDQNQKQYEEVRQRLVATEAELQRMEAVLEPVCKEYKEMNDKYELERECRNEAERYASKVTHQNKKLKRQSQFLLDKMHMGAVEINIEDFSDLEKADDAGDDSERDKLNDLIKSLQKETSELQNAIETVTVERDDALEREKQAVARSNALEEELASVNERCHELDRALKNLRRASTRVYQEAQDLKVHYHQEMELKRTAETYAHKMHVDREAMARQSAVLMTSAASDQRLMEALMKVEDLTRELESQKQSHQEEISDLKGNMEESADAAAKIADLESQLNDATDEIDRMKKQIKDMDKWKEKLAQENKSLTDKLDVAEQKLRPPPPPPPPPPPTIFKPLQFLKKKKTHVATTLTQKETDPKYQKAMEEMMERIRTGRALRPAPDRKMSLPTSSSSSAIGELQDILGSLKRQGSLDSGVARMGNKAVYSSRTLPCRLNRVEAIDSGDETELMKVFQKVCPTKDGKNLSRISEEDERGLPSPKNSSEVPFDRLNSSNI